MKNGALLLYISISLFTAVSAYSDDHLDECINSYSFIGICRIVEFKQGNQTYAYFKPINTIHKLNVERKNAFYMGETYLRHKNKLVVLLIGNGLHGEKRIRFVKEEDKNPILLKHAGEIYRLNDFNSIQVEGDKLEKQ